MKQSMKTLGICVAAMLMANTVWAGGEVTIVKQLNGTASDAAGTVTSEIQAESGLCTLTATPAAGNYITVEFITAERTIDGGSAQARFRAPGMDGNAIEVTAVDATADPSGVTTYTFPMPTSDYDVEVVANFQSRISIATGTLTLTIPQGGYTYDGEAKEPAVTVTLGDDVLAAANYEVEYSNNTEATTAEQQATVTVTGQGAYTGELTENFAIAARMLTEEMLWSEGDDFVVYDGEEKTISLGMYDAERKTDLTEDEDYTVAYSDNTNVGTVVVTVEGMGNYQGTVTKTFDIVRELNLMFGTENTSQWATYYAAENLTLPEQLKAYIVTGVTGTTVNVDEVTYIPQGVAVLLEKLEEFDMLYAAAYDGEVGTFTANQLRGCAEATPVAGLTAENDIYVLYNDEFVKTTKGTIPVNRCYLPVSKQAAAPARLTIGLDDEETGIGATLMNSERVNSEVYSLSGLRVAQPTKGLYIMDGRKVVVK